MLVPRYNLEKIVGFDAPHNYPLVLGEAPTKISPAWGQPSRYYFACRALYSTDA